jgi:hypothetical protein
MPSYGARGGMSYARGGPVSMPHAGNARASAQVSGGAHGGGYVGNSRGR